ncbi:MAG: methyltransferase domain-containing protein [Desulfovibrio sp.]
MRKNSSAPDVYGNAFSLYRDDRAAFERFIRYFGERFSANGLDPDALFRGKRCLDVGCGSGRGSFFMCAHGAASVVGVDYSHKNIETCEHFARELGVANASFQQGDAHSLPFEDEAFDFVWCNGVLHHIKDTDKGLAECARVLRAGGGFWLYLYGAGGVEWALVDFIRANLVHDVDYDTTFRFLQLIEAEKGNTSEYLDNWYVPYLRRYTDADVVRRLVSLGFEKPSRLLRDCGQRVIDMALKPVLGEQNLRYCLRKVRHTPLAQDALPLPDVRGIGSAYEDTLKVRDAIAQCERELLPKLRELAARNKGQAALVQIAVARRLNGVILEEIEKGAGFDFMNVLKAVQQIAPNLSIA